MAEIINLIRNERIGDYNEVSEKLTAACGVKQVAATKVGSDSMVLSFEKFYARTNSFASLTVVLENRENDNKATIIASGAGESLLNLSFGANAGFAAKAQKILCKELGFVSTGK